MSVERLFNSAMTGDMQRDGYLSVLKEGIKSPPRKAAEIIMAEAGRGMRMVGFGGRTRLESGESVTFGRNTDALLFGCAILGIEETLVNGEYDPQLIPEQFEEYTSGVYTFRVDNQDIEVLTYGDWLRMIYSAEKDKSLLDILNLGLPSSLSRILRSDKERYKRIESAIFPSYLKMLENLA